MSPYRRTSGIAPVRMVAKSVEPGTVVRLADDGPHVLAAGADDLVRVVLPRRPAEQAPRPVEHEIVSLEGDPASLGVEQIPNVHPSILPATNPNSTLSPTGCRASLLELPCPSVRHPAEPACPATHAGAPLGQTRKTAVAPRRPVCNVAGVFLNRHRYRSPAQLSNDSQSADRHRPSAKRDSPARRDRPSKHKLEALGERSRTICLTCTVQVRRVAGRSISTFLGEHRRRVC